MDPAFEEISELRMYLISVYFVVTTLATVGYGSWLLPFFFHPQLWLGDIVAISDIEYILVVLLMLAG